MNYVTCENEWDFIHNEVQFENMDTTEIPDASVIYVNMLTFDQFSSFPSKFISSKYILRCNDTSILSKAFYRRHGENNDTNVWLRWSRLPLPEKPLNSDIFPWYFVTLIHSLHFAIYRHFHIIDRHIVFVVSQELMGLLL